jgi:hypothetical protein
VSSEFRVSATGEGKSPLVFTALLVMVGTSLAQGRPVTASTAGAPVGALPVHSARVVTTARAVTPSLNLWPSATLIPKQTRPRSFAESAAAAGHLRDPETGLPQSDAPNSYVGFPIKWENTPANVSPQVVSIARNFRHNGVPILHLWGSGRNLLAVGFNPHGVPGVYFTQKMD